MADKTTTLKTKTNDNVYPNIIGDNRDNAIVDSAHINHTLTAAHKINFRLDTNVSKLIFNSLQKPEGLTKTKLVGVGTNGQENIEIGDNLTLANGKLSASGGDFTNKLFQHSIRIDCRTNSRNFLVYFTMLSPTANEFTTIKAIHDYMIEAYGEYFYLTGYVRDTDKNDYGVHISPYRADKTVLNITLLYKNNSDDFIGEGIFELTESTDCTITDKVFKLI